MVYMESQMHTTDREGEVRVVLYERGELPPPAAERADSIHAQLESLEERGILADVERREWVKRAPVDGCDRDLRDTYLSFTNWANQAAVRLTPFFQTRECFSPDAGERVDWLVMPAFCLAVYTDDVVSAVYPHTDGDETKTVEDGLEELDLVGEDELTVEPGSAIAD